MRLLICTPCFNGNVESDFMGCLLNSLRSLSDYNVSAEVYLTKEMSFISLARNHCAAYFLLGDYDKLLFIDADQTWRPDELECLIRSKHSLVGGVYSKKTLPLDMNFTPLPEHAHYFPGGAKPPESFLRYANETADAEGEIEVQHLATGFMLIDRSVFESLKPGCPDYITKVNQHAEDIRHWDFFPGGVIQGKFLTEDYFFCSQAKEAGHPPYLSIYAMPGHIGKFNYQVPRDERPQRGVR